MKKLFLLLLLCCATPLFAQDMDLQAENSQYKVFFKIEKQGQEDEANQIGVYVLNKETERMFKLFTSDTEERVANEPDSMGQLSNLLGACFYEGEPTRLIITECFNFHTDYSVIIDLKTRKFIKLGWGNPIGFTQENNFVILNGFSYYSEGGRYDVLRIYDANGKLVKNVDVK